MDERRLGDTDEFEPRWDQYDDDDGWLAYKEASMFGDPNETYDGPRCDRCGDDYEVRTRLRWLWRYGVRPCPSCSVPPRWWRRWWSAIRNRAYAIRYARRNRRWKSGQEAPF